MVPPSKHSIVGPTLVISWQGRGRFPGKNIRTVALHVPTDSNIPTLESVGNVAVGFQEKTYDGPTLESVGNIAVGFQHYADGKPSVHSIGCNDSTNNLLNIYLISDDIA